MIALLFVAGILLFILWLKNRQKLQSQISILNFQLADLKKSNEHLFEQVSDLENKNSALSKYQDIVDTEVKVKEMLFEAEKNAKTTLDDAFNLKTQAKIELDQAYTSAKTLKTQATIDADVIKNDADTHINIARKEAILIIENANKKAEEIAGDAYKALRNVSELERTAEAMKNIIKGYGDQYLVPTMSLLDDLAEEFSHTQAGEQLKFAREKMRGLIKHGMSAKCDYVEAYRKQTAINFILDAFNGKVDSILSKVKKDNYGKLEQQIKDAFQIVNNNGQAFRNAVITTLYLEARIDELKWAVITQELKWDEQEEQRRIKEQIREEEKARREFERAIKEAQKEEETLKRLIEKAQKEISLASAEQKAKYEEKLRELEGRLVLAEEKNLRAISMAQQTKSGNVYVISNVGSFGENVYKIGMTRRLEPLDRIRELGDASVPFEFDVHSMIFSDNAPQLERELHKKFMRLQMNKVNPRKEFFKVTLADIKAEVDQLNIDVKWTMAAEARQYKETLAIEQMISNDKQKELEWEQRQLEIERVTADAEEEIEAL